jgi:outer membrane protein OmpA-like peptidoglycan-associated protein
MGKDPLGLEWNNTAIIRVRSSSKLERFQNNMTTFKMSRTLIILSIVGIGLFGSYGCKNVSKTAKGGAIGAGAGAAAGAIIGKTYGNTTTGAIIGAAVGGTVGAVIGRQMDNQARELEQSLKDAEIERVGEGIAIKFESGILFGFDSDVIQQNGRTNLTNLANSLKQYPDTEILIVGHTDSSGSDSYNLGLSERRARSAMGHLTAQGIAASRIKTVGRGESEPIADNETEAGRAQNRRVEIAIVAGDAMIKKLQSN